MNKDKETFIKLRLSDSDDFESMELIPLNAENEEFSIDDKELPNDLAILPLRNMVLFPGMVIPITVGRQKSVKMVKKAYKGNKIIGVLAQSKQTKDEPNTEDLYKVGTVAYIIKMIVLPDGNVTIIVQGKKRFEVEEFIHQDPFLLAKVSYK